MSCVCLLRCSWPFQYFPWKHARAFGQDDLQVEKKILLRASFHFKLFPGDALAQLALGCFMCALLRQGQLSLPCAVMFWHSLHFGYNKMLFAQA